MKTKWKRRKFLSYFLLLLFRSKLISLENKKHFKTLIIWIIIIKKTKQSIEVNKLKTDLDLNI